MGLSKLYLDTCETEISKSEFQDSDEIIDLYIDEIEYLNLKLKNNNYIPILTTKIAMLLFTNANILFSPPDGLHF